MRTPTSGKKKTGPQTLGRRRFQRRQQYLERKMNHLDLALLSPIEARDLLIGSAASVRRVIRRISRSQLIKKFKIRLPGSADQDVAEVTTPPRPSRELSRLNRSKVFPPLVPGELNTLSCTAAEILAGLIHSQPKAPPHLLIDSLATASGLSLDCCAELLLGHNLGKEDIAAVKSAREFWKQYGEGKSRYQAFAVGKAVPRFAGEWAHFDEFELESLLPGIEIPVRLRRHDYLTNYISEANGGCLDVYSGTDFRALFQHPFPLQFHPLLFGKPPQERLSLEDVCADRHR